MVRALPASPVLVSLTSSLKTHWPLTVVAAPLVPLNSTLPLTSLVQAVALFIRRFFPALYKSLGIYLPLITTNCAVLGVVQSNTDTGLDFLSSLANGVGTSLGYFLVIFLFACIRERFEGTKMPKAMKGVPIALVTAGLLALSFYGLQGII